ncbi:hypothetical protein ACIQXR_04705 [Peribacillus sp. NPDC097224]|uniref:hypothetical protein n=1 Tax=Peribacillus sp. NPDC097224 TaxID=3364399 RepID=UPI003821CAFF
MAFERNKIIMNPNHRKMAVADMSSPIHGENQKLLALLKEMEKKKCVNIIKRKAEMYEGI